MNLQEIGQQQVFRDITGHNCSTYLPREFAAPVSVVGFLIFRIKLN